MSREKVVLIYSETEDPVVSYLTSTNSTVVLHVDEIAPLLRSADDVWSYYADEGAIQSAFGHLFEGKFVVNRIFAIAETEFLRRLQQLGFSDRWAFIILKSLISRSAWSAHDTGVRGVSKSLQPLHLQWLRVEQAMGGVVSTPKFSYAFADLPPKLSEMINPFQKSIWSFADWQEERHLPASEANYSRFFVERPVGVPVICYFFGSRTQLIFPKGGANVDLEILGCCVKKLRDIFRSEMGEALFYWEADEKLRFYSFSPYLYTAADDERFESEIISYFKENIAIAA